MLLRSGGEQVARPRGCFVCGDEAAPGIHTKCREDRTYLRSLERRAEQAAEGWAEYHADLAADRYVGRSNDLQLDVGEGDGYDEPDYLRSPL